MQSKVYLEANLQMQTLTKQEKIRSQIKKLEREQHNENQRKQEKKTNKTKVIYQ